MHRYDQLTDKQRSLFLELGRNVLPVDWVQFRLIYRSSSGVLSALRKLAILGLAIENSVHSWRLTPAGRLIWKRKASARLDLGPVNRPYIAEPNASP